jgi:UDP-glucose 4-epimerase
MSEQISVIIGGTGFIGRNLVEALIRQGDSVRVICRRPLAPDSPRSAQGVQCIVGDYGDPEVLAAALPGATRVFHLASTTQPQSSNNDMAFDIESNLLPSVRLAAACVQLKLRLVFVSSGGTVYGVARDLPIREDHPTDPLCSYGIVKLAAEKYFHLHESLHGLDYRVLRVANPFGPGQHRNPLQGVVGNFIHQLAAGQPLTVWGDGMVIRDYVFMDDVIRALVAVALHQGPGRTYNIGSGVGRSLVNVIEVISAALKRPATVEFSPSRKFDIPANVMDISSAGRDLGWRPEISFEEGVLKTISSVFHG